MVVCQDGFVVGGFPAVLSIAPPTAKQTYYNRAHVFGCVSDVQMDATTPSILPNQHPSLGDETNVCRRNQQTHEPRPSPNKNTENIKLKIPCQNNRESFKIMLHQPTQNAHKKLTRQGSKSSRAPKKHTKTPLYKSVRTSPPAPLFCSRCSRRSCQPP